MARLFVPESQIYVLIRPGGQTQMLGADGVIHSLDQALAFAPDIAVIANPAPMHMQYALPLARLGTHLLVEKPIASALEGVADLITAARNMGSTLLVGYNLRFLPSLREFRRLIGDGLIGRCYSVRSEVGQYLPTWRPGVDYRKSVSANKELGGGVLLELSHELDYLCWIFGQVTSVYASLSTQSDLQISVEDTADLILNFASLNGYPSVVGTLHMDFSRQDHIRVCTVVGDKGTLRWNAMTGEVDFFGFGATHWRNVYHDKPERDATYIAEWAHLIDCIENRHPPLITGEDGLAVLQVVDNARQSALSGNRVDVPISTKAKFKANA
jgi:predicted dehydrogenase